MRPGLRNKEFTYHGLITLRTSEGDTGKHGILNGRTEYRNNGITSNAGNENALNFANTARAIGIQRGTVSLYVVGSKVALPLPSGLV